MAYPPGWVPSVGLPLPSGRRSLRFYMAGTATADFADNAFNFAEKIATGFEPMSIPPSPVVPPGGETVSAVVNSPEGGQRAGSLPAASRVSPITTQAAFTIRIHNDGGGDLSFSFDGVNVHGVVTAADGKLEYRSRLETGIAVMGVSVAYRIEAW